MVLRKSISRLRDYLQFTVDRFPVATVLALFAAGIIFWGGFNTSMEATNTEQFCVGCHEMRDNVYPEYQKSIHYRNTTGVRASCPDCHVPKQWVFKFRRKVAATNELYHTIMGTIDSREKFEDRREHLAKTVWTTMKNTDSRECRNCHKLDFMDTENQSSSAKLFHDYASRKDWTCIDCHKGIAHELPKDYTDVAFSELVDAMHVEFETDDTQCQNCHEGMAHAEW